MINDANSHAGEQVVITYQVKVTSENDTITNTATAGHENGNEYGSKESKTYEGNITLTKYGENNVTLANAGFEVRKDGAAAARLNQPLGEQEEQIHILPGSYEAGEGLQLSGTKILMKTGKKMGQIKEFLQGSSQDICLVENCGMDDERIVRSVEEISEDAGYYSLLIVKDRKR